MGCWDDVRAKVAKSEAEFKATKKSLDALGWTMRVTEYGQWTATSKPRFGAQQTITARNAAELLAKARGLPLGCGGKS